MLAGDLILGCRVRINDLPRTLPAPSVAASVSIVVAPSTLPIGNYYIVLTFTNSFGQTIATPESGPFNIADAAHSLQVTAPAIASIPGATGINVYYGQAVGGENQWLPASSLPFTISGLGNPGIPPTRNTSFYPDVDGQRISAYTIYQWLNKALDIASNISDGIPDMTALPTVANQAMYQLIGQWMKIDHGWWDGYGISLGGRDDLFYRNVVPGVVRTGVLQQVSNNYIIELQPQPNRSGGSTTINGAITISANSIIATDVSGFKLPFGMALLGVPPDPTKCEVISFSTISGNTLGGVIRGMGGTVQQAWPTLTPIAEANLRLSGMRSFISPSFAPGDSLKTLPIPSGWSYPIEDFMVSRFRETEGNVSEANRLMQSFERSIKDYLKGNKLTAGPRQVGAPGQSGMDTYPMAGSGGRWIIP
jgi:hypothetical protein